MGDSRELEFNSHELNYDDFEFDDSERTDGGQDDGTSNPYENWAAYDPYDSEDGVSDESEGGQIFSSQALIKAGTFAAQSAPSEDEDSD